MSKKIFFISLGLFLIVLGIFLWRSYSAGTLFSGKKTEINAENLNQTTKKISEEGMVSQTANQKGLEKIVEGRVSGAIFLKEENKLVYYFNQNFMKADLDGQNRESVGAHPFQKVEEVSWSFGKERALIKDSGKYFIFDLKKEEITPFLAPTELIVWGSLNGQILYEYFDTKTGRRILDSSFDLSGKTWEETTDLPYEKADLLVHPLKNEALIFPDPGQGGVGDVFRVDVAIKKKDKFLSHYKGIDFLFSPSGKKILESYVKKDGRMSLGIVDSVSGAFNDLNFPTSVKKCVWKKDETEVFCAAILSEEKVNLPEDWENKKGVFRDVFWKINVQNGKQTRFLELENAEQTDAEGLFLDGEEKRLFFVDRLTGGLFRINLPEKENEPEN